MDLLPVEIIGNILSHLGAARDVVIASGTCRKWREAYRKHLHVLSFNSNDWSVYRDLTSATIEILITQTMFQTTGLQGLSILMDDVDEFSASTVMAWLMYTRETLRWLFYNVRTLPSINVLGICGRQRLEVLVLAHNSITGIEPNYQRFACLTTLSLSYVSISALDLSLLLTACPKIENLVLVYPEIAISDAQVTVELNSPTLRSIYVESISLDKFVLEADNLESLHLKDCVLEVFELIGKGSLKYFKVDYLSVIHLDVGEAVDNLETVDVSNFTIIWSKFYQMISRSSKLRKLRLWDVVFDEEDEIVDLETIAVCFPQLNYLALSYDDLKNRVLPNGSQGSSSLQSIVTLETGCAVINDLFMYWVAGFLKRCPNLRKLVVHGVISESKTHEECQMLANFTSSMVQLMRKYIHVDVQFEYE